jgi:peptidoglycan/xylan/chitin deacetylase (PgdA/CDA1 family)
MTRLLSLAILPLIMLSCICSPNTKSEQKEAPAQETAQKLIALTFDDGPNDITTPKVLDILEEHNVPASFFVIGQFINDETAKQMTRAISLGCEIQNHSFTHAFMTKLSAEEIAEEIRKTDELIVKYTGTKPWMFRPPYIDHNETMHQTIGHTFICGVGCDDWVPECTAQQRYDVMKAQAKDGVMFLLHDLVGNDNTVEALKMIIPELKAQGYTFVTATQLFEKKGIKPEPKNGKIYSNVMD